MSNIINLFNENTSNAVEDFFKQDVLNFKDYPDEDVRIYFRKPHKQHYKFDLSKIKSEIKREELRDYLKSIFIKEFPFKYNSGQLNYIFTMVDYFNIASWESVLDTTEEDAKALLEYLKKEKYAGKDNERHILAILERMQMAICEYRDTRTGLQRDIWYFKDFNIASERVNKTFNTNSFNFYKIKNKESRELIKMWYRYLLGNSELALTTLVNYLAHLCRFCSFLEYNGNKSIKDADRLTVRAFFDSLYELSTNTYNKNVNLLSDLYKYLTIKETYTNQTPVLLTDYKQEKREHYYNSVSEYVILQIFNHLHELPFELMLMYLINYCTGLRVSDICQLPVDCLLKSEKCYFIRFHIQKMQKDHAVPVSSALGELIEKQIAEISKLDYKEQYLFSRKPNLPFLPSTYRTSMKRWCEKWDIRNEDGSEYNFLPHSYRHTLATNLSQEYDVNLEIIQLVILGHANPSMTLCYIDNSNEYKKMQNDKYVNASGMEISLESKELLYPSWVKNNLVEHSLPNGICSYPTILGVCPNSDVCLNCQYFRTSAKFLDVHKNQLEKIEKEIRLYEQKGWINNLETAKDQKEKLQNIIQILERSAIDDKQAITT